MLVTNMTHFLKPEPIRFLRFSFTTAIVPYKQVWENLHLCPCPLMALGKNQFEVFIVHSFFIRTQCIYNAYINVAVDSK